MKIVVAPTPQETASEAAAWMARRIRSAVRLRGVCRVAVSGGGTPALMFDDLATMDLPWASVHVFQVDERVAPDGDPDRNAGQLAAHLTDRVPIRKANVHLMPVTAKSLSRAAATYASKLGDAPLDIVHLGIGDDGHTASWPPGDPVVDAPGEVAICGLFNGRIRMTLLPRVVNGARARMLLVVGAAKADPLAGWIERGESLPVAHVKRTDTTLFLDGPAASALPAGR
ncbi:MAG: pgl pgi [Ilumatobacteraceae bacterium]|nr:pgl pgi [Ilumatobacteraceae bacterium]